MSIVAICGYADIGVHHTTRIQQYAPASLPHLDVRNDHGQMSPVAPPATAALLARKRIIRIGMVADMQPISAENGAQAHQGIASDYLSLIGDAIDVQWRSAIYRDIGALLLALCSDEIDIAVAATPQSDVALGTRPFLVSPVVIFTKTSDCVQSNYMDRLQISSASGSASPPLHVAISQQHPELLSILNKAIQYPSKRDLHEVSNQWNGIDEFAVTWQPYRRQFILTGLGAAAVTFGLLSWALVLRYRIHVKRKHQRVLQEQFALQRRMIDVNPNPTYMWNPEGRLIACNQALLDLTGRPREKMIGTTLADDPNLDDDGRQKLGRAITSITAGQQRYIQELSFRVNGAVVHGLHWAVPVSDTNGQLIGILAGWTDITDRRLIEEHLREAKEAAEAANRAKSIFIATASHEIRTPLHGALGYLELLTRELLTPRGRVLLETVQQSFDVLQTQLNDILDFIKLEAQELVVETLPFDPKTLAEECARILAPLARRKNVEFLFLLDSALPDHICGDPVRVKQILLNLGANAVKFTDRGRITLSVNAISRPNDVCCLQIKVIDTGVGMSSTEVDKIFAPFIQANDTIYRRFGGTGLGMSICKRLVDLMDGELHVQSSLGKGSEFTLELPLGVLSGGGNGPSASSSAPLLPITLVSREPCMRRNLSALFKHWGACVTATSTLEPCGDDTASSSCLLVIAGPRLDELVPPPDDAINKYETCVLLASDGPLLPEHNAGCFRVSALQHSRLREFLVAASTGRIESLLHCNASPSQPHTTRMRRHEYILIADDEPVSRHLLAHQLRELGFNAIFTASNGHDALRICAVHPIDLLITDLSMPIVDGLTLVRAVRKAAYSMAVLVCTAATESLRVEEAAELGIQKCLHKPLSLECLRAAIDDVLLHVSSRHICTDVSNIAPPAPIAVSEGMLRTLYRTSWLQSNRAIASALASRDYPTLRQELHRLGGAIMVMGSEEAVLLCRQMIEMARQCDVDQQLHLLHRALEQSIEHALASEDQPHHLTALRPRP
ncbi:ATP-binding protein [Burkholderia ubonensis]|uniref:ATP-binding protein n=1 Tax=Burkholderia ubonensis TaxID=101571 RepID=UPI0018DF0CCD|nr:ATP-binding protein [Burkholderia ubonensis]